MRNKIKIKFIDFINEYYSHIKRFKNSDKKIAFINNTSNATSIALSRWLDKNGVRYKYNSSSTKSYYFVFKYDDINYNIRISNHTKPMLNPEIENVGVDVDVLVPTIINVSIDTSVGYTLSDIIKIFSSIRPTVETVYEFLKENPIDFSYVFTHPTQFDKIVKDDVQDFDMQNIYGKYKRTHVDKYGIAYTIMINEYKRIKSSSQYKLYRDKQNKL